MSTNAIETLQFNCTTCPSECLLTVEVERSPDGAVVEVRSVTGNSCPRGDKFAHQELTCPMRVLTTTVAVSGGDEALLPVRTAEAIPLALHAPSQTKDWESLMQKIRRFSSCFAPKSVPETIFMPTFRAESTKSNSLHSLFTETI